MATGSKWKEKEFSWAIKGLGDKIGSFVSVHVGGGQPWLF
jgi:hypothetical protein